MDLQNERGLTLVEVLAVLVIGAIISIIGTQILMMGYKSYEHVTAQSELRDEADFIMSNLVSEMYTLKTSEIKIKHLPHTESYDYYFELSENKIIGFTNNNVVINGRNLLLPESDIKVVFKNLANDEGTMIEEIDKGQFRITLVLNKEGTEHQLRLVSEIGVIHDSDNGKED